MISFHVKLPQCLKFNFIDELFELSLLSALKCKSYGKKRGVTCCCLWYFMKCHPYCGTVFIWLWLMFQVTILWSTCHGLEPLLSSSMIQQLPLSQPLVTLLCWSEVSTFSLDSPQPSPDLIHLESAEDLEHQLLLPSSTNLSNLSQSRGREWTPPGNPDPVWSRREDPTPGTRLPRRDNCQTSPSSPTNSSNLQTWSLQMRDNSPCCPGHSCPASDLSSSACLSCQHSDCHHCQVWGDQLLDQLLQLVPSHLLLQQQLDQPPLLLQPSDQLLQLRLDLLQLLQLQLDLLQWDSLTDQLLQLPSFLQSRLPSSSLRLHPTQDQLLQLLQQTSAAPLIQTHSASSRMLSKYQTINCLLSIIVFLIQINFT